MISQRRGFIKAAMATPLLSLFFTKSEYNHNEVITTRTLPKSISSDGGTFIKVVTCTFPQKHTFEEFTDISRIWTMPDFIPQIDVNFAQQGLLGGIEREMGHRHVSWTYRFKDLEAFAKWSSEVGRHKVFEPAKVLPGYRYHFKYLDIAEVAEPKHYASQDYPLYPAILASHRVKV